MRRAASLLSFILALTVAAAVIIYPRWIAGDMNAVPHGWLVLLLLGMSFSFVYGVGFRPRNRLLAFLFSPPVAWTLIFVSASVIYLEGPMGH